MGLVSHGLPDDGRKKISAVTHDLSDQLLEKFREVAIRRANSYWFRPLDALRVLEAAKATGLRLLGMDAASLDADSVTLWQADSWDYSRGSAPPVENVYEHANQFIRQRSERDLYFEIVLAD
jgi:hypothetical protein